MNTPPQMPHTLHIPKPHDPITKGIVVKANEAGRFFARHFYVVDLWDNPTETIVHGLLLTRAQRRRLMA